MIHHLLIRGIAGLQWLIQIWPSLEDWVKCKHKCEKDASHRTDHQIHAAQIKTAQWHSGNTWHKKRRSSVEENHPETQIRFHWKLI